MVEKHQDAHAVGADNELVFLVVGRDVKSDVGVSLVEFPMDLSSGEFLIIVGVESVVTLLDFSGDLNLEH